MALQDTDTDMYADNKTITNSKDIAETFNDFFVNISQFLTSHRLLKILS